METILVTGGAGFIGSHLCEALVGRFRVVCVDNLNDYYPPEFKLKNLSALLKNQNFRLVKEDILNYKGINNIFLEEKPYKIIHLAARAGVRPSVEDPFTYAEVNVRGTLNLLELSRQYKVRQFIYGSSSSVYGANKKSLFSESDITDSPISPYAATKKAGELLCHTFSRIYNMNITCLRFFTVYGPRGRPDMAPYLFTKLIDEGKPILVYGDGTSKRDYTYITDIIKGILLSLSKEYNYEIFNLGNSRTIGLLEFISLIEKELGKKAFIVNKEVQKGDLPYTCADISKAKRELGYNPETDIERGVHNLIKWYLSERK